MSIVNEELSSLIPVGDRKILKTTLILILSKEVIKKKKKKVKERIRIVSFNSEKDSHLSRVYCRRGTYTIIINLLLLKEGSLFKWKRQKFHRLRLSSLLSSSGYVEDCVLKWQLSLSRGRPYIIHTSLQTTYCHC